MNYLLVGLMGLAGLAACSGQRLLARLRPRRLGWTRRLGRSSGKIVDAYFADGAKGDLVSYKSDFKAAEKEGKKAYEANKEEIAKKKEATKSGIEKLSAALEKGDISQAEYEQGAAKLA